MDLRERDEALWPEFKGHLKNPDYCLRGVHKSRIVLYKIDEPVMMIGRDPKGRIPLDDPVVSRHHALIETEGDQIFISDLGSDNGTFVNGERLAPREKTQILPGDEIRLADYRFMLQEDDPQDVEGTTQIHAGSKRPQGPPIAFPPDAPEQRPLENTLCLDTDELREMAKMKERAEAEGARLFIKNGSKRNLPFAVNHAEEFIGRGKRAHIHLKDRAASKLHARIVQRKDRFYIYDNNSLNGTYVNGQKIRGQALCNGDILLVGKTEMIFIDPDSPQSDAKGNEVDKKHREILKSAGKRRDVPSDRDWARILFWTAVAAASVAGIGYSILQIF